MTIGEPHVLVQGDIRLAAGATVSCSTTMGGSTWPEVSSYVGEEWVGDYHVFMVTMDIYLEPADYSYTTTCTTSDGVSWSGSGTATQDLFIGVGATWP